MTMHRVANETPFTFSTKTYERRGSHLNPLFIFCKHFFYKYKLETERRFSNLHKGTCVSGTLVTLKGKPLLGILQTTHNNNIKK